MNQKEIKDFITLIEHVRADISYGAGGSYVNPNDESMETVDIKAIRASERAINHIKRLILTSK